MADRPTTAPAGSTRDPGAVRPATASHDLRPFTALGEHDVLKERGFPGHHWRFHYPYNSSPVGHMGYFDVYCRWDGETGTGTASGTVDACPWDPQMRHARLTYSRRPSAAHFGPGWDNPHEAPHLAQARRSYVTGDKPVDIADMTKWVRTLQPRSTHDLRPMTVLLQGVVDSMVNDKLELFSSREDGLQGKLKVANGRIDDLSAYIQYLEEELEKLGGDLNAMKASEKMRSKVDDIIKERLRKELEQQRLALAAEWQNKLDQAVGDAVAFEKAKAKKMNEGLTKEVSELKEKLRKYLDESGELVSRLQAAEEEISRKTFEIEDLNTEVQNMEAKVEEANDDKRAAERRAQQSDMLKDLAEETLRGTKFMPWATFRPIVQREFAGMILEGLYTISLSPKSTGMAPLEENVAGYIFDLPSTSEISLDSSVRDPENKYSLVAFPTNTVLKFNRPSAIIELPPGAWVSFSTAHAQKLPRYCVVQLDPAEAPFGDPFDEKGNYACTGEEDFETYIGVNSVVHMPDTMRSKISVPSGSAVFIRVGADRMVSLPHDTTMVLTTFSDNNVVCVPNKTQISLPDAGNYLSIMSPANSVWTCAGFMGNPHTAITIPPGTMIEAPEDAVATKNVEPGKTKVIQDVIPHTLTVPEGCKITIPVLKGAKAPKLVAKRLHIIGPVGASQAISMMSTEIASLVLRELPKDYASKMLESLDRVTFYKIYEYMGPKIQSYAALMDRGIRTMFYSHQPSEQFAKDLQIFGPDLPAALEGFKSLTKLLDSIDEDPTRRFHASVVSNVIGPKCTSRLITGGTAISTASTLNHYAALQRTEAAYTIRELYEWVDQYADLTERNKETDMLRAGVLQWVASADSGRELDSRVEELFDLMKDKYNTRCTITKTTSTALKWHSEGEVSLFSAEAILKNRKKKLIPSAAPKPTPNGDGEQLDKSAYLDVFTLSDIEYVEQRCEDEVEIVHSTENLFIGADSADKYLQSKPLGEKSTALLLRASALVAAQAHACKLREVEALWHNPFMIVPIFNREDDQIEPWGFITMMIADYRELDDDVVEVPFPTRSAQCMILASQAMSVVISRLYKIQRKAYRELVNGTLVKTDYDCELIASIYHERAKGLGFAMMDDQLTICEDITELKAYRHAPDAVIICLSALLLLLGNRAVYKCLTKRGATPRTAWPEVKQHLQLASEHPKFIIRLIVDMCKAPVMECDVDDDLVVHAKLLLDQTSEDSAARASRATDIVYRCAMYLIQMQIEIENAKKVIAVQKIRKFTRRRLNRIQSTEPDNDSPSDEEISEIG
ncbi:hypothetical protein NFJ02_03g102080 [Pycnococcus provasolii]